MKRKLDAQIFDAKNLQNKFGNKKIDFKSIVVEDDDYAIDDYDIIQIGTHINDFYHAKFRSLTEKYGKAEKSNMEIIHNEYTQRCSSFDLNRKLRKGKSLDKNEKKIYNAINNTCNNNKLEENIILFGYFSKEFIYKYNIEFNRLNQSSISNAIFKFKKDILDKKIKERDWGFISSSCDLKKNVFKSRDILLVFYVEKGRYLDVTNKEKETEIILSKGMIYHFFDYCFIEVKLLGEKCYQMVIKAFIKNNYWPFLLFSLNYY